MAGIAERPVCSEDELARLRQLSSDGKADRRLSKRARLILLSAEGWTDVKIASELGMRQADVGVWRKRFIAKRMEGLLDKPRPGRAPRRNRPETLGKALSALGNAPPEGKGRWDGRSLAEELDMPPHAVFETLKHAGENLARRRLWEARNGPSLSGIAVSPAGLFLNPPENALLLALSGASEPPPLEATLGCLTTHRGQLVKAMGAERHRCSRLGLSELIELAAGQIRDGERLEAPRILFPDFLKRTMRSLGEKTEIAVVLCGGSEETEAGCAKDGFGPGIFHRLEPSAWLGAVSSILWLCQRGREGGAEEARKLGEAIGLFISVFREGSEPFAWSRRRAGPAYRSDINYFYVN